MSRFKGISWLERLTPGTIELLVDAVGASAYCVGLAACLLQFRGYQSPLWQTALIGVLWITLAALVSRRWWLGPLAAAVGLVGVWLASLQDHGQQISAAITNLAGWLVVFFDPGAVAPQGYFLLTLALLLPLALLCFLTVRFCSSPLVYLLATLGVLVPVAAWYPEAGPAFLIVVAGLMIQLPRAFTRQMQKKRPQDSALPRGPMQLLAIPVIVLCLVLASLAVPARTASWRLPVLVNWLQDLGDYWQNHYGPGRPWPSFNLVTYGYGDAGQRLGGPVTLSKTAILRVTTDQPVLLRGSTRTIYTGQAWQQLAQPQYRFDSLLWNSKRQTVFGTGPAGSQASKDFKAAWARPLQLQVQDLQGLNILFSQGMVRQISLKDRFSHTPFFTGDGDLFFPYALPAYFTYTIKTAVYDHRQTGFAEAMAAFEQARAGTGSTDPAWPAVRSAYLQLPDQLPAIVGTTARQAAAGSDLPYEQAVSLEKYLRENFTYTLSPDQPPADTDFVTYFLASRRGYCVYYASAMVVMARTLGIPARYVEGFALDAGSVTGTTTHTYLATGQTAHAWAELYFEGVGWLTFDATPPAPATGPDGQTPGNGEPTAAPTPTIVPVGPDQATGQPAMGWLWLIILAAILLGLGILRLGLSLAWRRHRRSLTPAYVFQKYPGPAAGLNYLYKDILKQLACLDVRPEKGETLAQFAERAEGYTLIAGYPLPELFWPVSQLHYGDIEPAPVTLQRLAELRQQLEARLQARMPKAAYWLRRVLARHHPDRPARSI